MVGKTKEASRPTVIFCSSEKATRKRASKLVTSRGILDKYPGFAIMDTDLFVPSLPVASMGGTQDSTLSKLPDTRAGSDLDPDSTYAENPKNSGYKADLSDESDEIDGSFVTARVGFTSKSKNEPKNPSGDQYRLLKMNEDLLHPTRYQAKLGGLQARIFESSAAARKDSDRLVLELRDQESILVECEAIIQCINEPNRLSLWNSGHFQRLPSLILGS